MKWYHLIQPGVILILSVILYFCCCHKKVTDHSGGTADSTRYYKNKLGETVAYIKKKDEDYAKAIWDLDSLAMLYNTKPKHIKEVLQVISKSKDTLKPKGEVIVDWQTPPPYRENGEWKTIDTTRQVRMLSQMFESNYHIAEVTIDRLGDSSRLLISSVDTIDVVTKQVIEGPLWNRRKWVVLDVKNRNPNTLITQVNAYRQLLPKPKRFGIGIQGGYGFSSGLTPKPYVGVGISYNLIRF